MSETTPDKKVYIKTFGCQMNEYDSGKMRALLGQDGYVSVEDPDQADVILVNTCSVREKPEHKLHSFIGEVKHLRKKGVRIGIAGCIAQYDEERLFRKYRRDVERALGPDQVPKMQSLDDRAGKERALANDFMDLYDNAFV